MKYTKYLAGILKERGIPNLSPTAFGKLMNIVHLEARVETFKKANQICAKTGEPRKFDMEKFRADSELTKLSGNVEPAELMRVLCLSGYI